MENFKYKKGFSSQEFDEAKNSIIEQGLEYKKVRVEDALKETIPVCLDAAYKNPSSMRTDAPEAFSCSSLISYLYVQAGVWMPSISVDKYVFGTPISKEELQFGDLIFSNSKKGRIYTETVEYLPGTKVPEGVDHVGMYMGNGEVLHASHTIGKVGIEKISESQSFKNIVGYRRVADINEERTVVIMAGK